jgi:hypothetical protein
MSEATDLSRRCLAVCNESDPHLRRTAIELLRAEDGCYVNPLAAVADHEDIAEPIGTVQQQVNGHGFRLIDDVDAHHNLARYRWGLVPVGGGETLAEGFDATVTGADGRIASVVGFLDRVPAA